MCGRFEIHSVIELLAKIFQLDSVGFDIRPNYNVAPGQDIPIIINDGKKNVLLASRWGFIPSWAKEKKAAYSMINARAEAVAAARSYKDAFLNQRCIVVADGFYEWQKLDKQKIPFYARLKSKMPMAFAGLYNNWKSPEGKELCTSAIITTDANSLLQPLHDRMPVILQPSSYETWLRPDEQKKSVLLPLLTTFPSEGLEVFRVTSKVSSYKNNSPENIEPVP